MTGRSDRKSDTDYQPSSGSTRLDAWDAALRANDIERFVETDLDPSLHAHIDLHLTAEAARLVALKTRQDLAVQVLSIANSKSRTILSLFRATEQQLPPMPPGDRLI